MAINPYMVITDQNGSLVLGESQTAVYDPYAKQAVSRPVEIDSLDGRTEIPITVGSGGSGSGRIVYDPFVVSKAVDAVSQTTFLTHAKGISWKYVDILFVKATDEGGPATRPYLSYRLGTVAISQIDTSSDGDRVSERVSFVFATLQIGYQAQKADGSYAPFAPVGWDRVRNIQI